MKPLRTCVGSRKDQPSWEVVQGHGCLQRFVHAGSSWLQTHDSGNLWGLQCLTQHPWSRLNW